jgi:hypothetical protein
MRTALPFEILRIFYREQRQKAAISDKNMPP